MKISITNLVSGEELDYSLPLLIGKVFNSNGVINVNVTNTTLQKTLSWPVRNSQFKALVQLTPGLNTIIISCLGISEEITLTYKISKCKYFVRPVYIRCKDDPGCFQAPDSQDNSPQSAQRRITLGAQLIQTFTAEKINEQALGRVTFQLETDQNHRPICYIFTTSLTLNEAHSMSGNELWTHFAREFMSSNLPNKEYCKWYAFMSFTRYSVKEGFIPKTHAEILQHTKGHTALGGGGLALFGTGNLHTWAESLDEVLPRLTDCQKINKAQLMDDSAYRQYYWANYSTGLGASLHELGHTFDLGHTPSGIMARGFDDLYRVFTVQPHTQGKKYSIYNHSNTDKTVQVKQQKPIATNKRIPRVRHNSAPTTVDVFIQIEPAFQRTKPECRQLMIVRNYDGTETRKLLSSSQYTTRNNRIRSETRPLNDSCCEEHNNHSVITESQSQPVSVQNSPVRVLPAKLPNTSETLPISIKSKPKQQCPDGGAYWFRSSAVLLRYHKWFNCYEDCPKIPRPMEINKNMVTSLYGLRIVELRSIPEGVVIRHWEFSGPASAKYFRIDGEEAKNKSQNALMVSVIAEDERGNVIKKKVQTAELTAE
ncbi:uncharacterized protein LOC141900467 [Tubulanus polymorphus]|uniref:uncharacterized protein LOC141900467 n=1 Tax=Tubulanus polymorphus TaxID=672921 RepID=UPI003DA3C9DC